MLQSNTPYKAEMIYLRKVVNAIDIEHDIKEMFAEKHVRGEWYRFTESDLEYIQRYVEDISSTPIKVEQPELFTLLKGMKNGT